jgi:ribosomal protein S18
MKLAVPVQSSCELECVSALALPPSISLFALRCGTPETPPGIRCRSLPAEGSLNGASLPGLGGLIDALAEEQPDACLILGGSTLAKFTAFAADLLDISVFSMIWTAVELANLPRRAKPRPDLFFLTDAALLPPAARDPQYGSNLAPTGDPRTDPEANARIAAMALRWQSGTPQPPELSILVPAYREAANLPLVCKRLEEALDRSGIAAEILLIDDGSPDDTYEVALRQMWRSPRIRAFTKPAPRGMGNAIRYGLELARAPIAAITMGDASDDVAGIPEMFRKVRDEGFALAIGSRYGRRENYKNVPLLYRFWSRCFRIAARAATGLALKDYTNAFRVFDRRIFAGGGPESGGFEISPEITFKAWFRTRRIAEVDVKHLKRASGQSNFSFLRAGPGYARILAKAAVNRLTGYWFHLGWYMNLEQEGPSAPGRPREERA